MVLFTSGNPGKNKIDTLLEASVPHLGFLSSPEKVLLVKLICKDEALVVAANKINFIYPQHGVSLGKCAVEHAIKAAILSVDNTYLAIVDDGNLLSIWNLKKDTQEFQTPINGQDFSCAQFSPAGKILVVGFKNGIIRFFADHGPGWIEEAPLATARSCVKFIAFNSTGAQFLTKSDNPNAIPSSCEVWDGNGGGLLHELSEAQWPDAWIWACFTPDDKQVITISRDSICLYDTQTWAKKQSFSKQEGVPLAVAIHPSGDHIVISNRWTDMKIGRRFPIEVNTVLMYHIPSGKLCGQFTGHVHAHQIPIISFDKTGDKLITKSVNEIRMWNVRKLRLFWNNMLQPKQILFLLFVSEIAHMRAMVKLFPPERVFKKGTPVIKKEGIMLDLNTYAHLKEIFDSLPAGLKGLVIKFVKFHK